MILFLTLITLICLLSAAIIFMKILGLFISPYKKYLDAKLQIKYLKIQNEHLKKVIKTTSNQ